MHVLYRESLVRKCSFLKSLLLANVFEIVFPFSLPHMLMCCSISFHVYFLQCFIYIFNSSLEVLVVEMRSLWWDLHSKLSCLVMFDHLRSCFHIQKEIIINLWKHRSDKCLKIWKYVKGHALIFLKCKFEPKYFVLKAGVHFSDLTWCRKRKDWYLQNFKD